MLLFYKNGYHCVAANYKWIKPFLTDAEIYSKTKVNRIWSHTYLNCRINENLFRQKMSTIAQLTSGKYLIQENSFFYENASVQDYSMISFTTFTAFWVILNKCK